jgi:hypothetical protein
VVALDGTDEPLVRFSEELARNCDATIVLLHVVPEVSEALLVYGIPGVEDRPLSREVAERRLRDLTAGLSLPHLTSIASGSAYRCIANAAREHNVDVVTTGRQRAGAIADLEPASVLARVSCPVISVPVASHAVHRRGVAQTRVRAADIQQSTYTSSLVTLVTKKLNVTRPSA